MNREELEKKWEKAGFKDSVIFAWVVSENKDICLEILQIILPELNITRIVEIRSEDTRKDSRVLRGVRFDVYVEDDKGRMYDIEMQVNNNHDLGKRLSYYQSNLVRQSLTEGQSFLEKVDTYVIFICDYDFGGSGLPRYTTRLILDENGKTIDTGEHNVILNAKAKDFAGVSEKLKAFLEYVNSSLITSDLTQRIETSVENLKKSVERKGSYMTYEQEMLTREYYARKEGREEGREEGKKDLLEKSIKKLSKQGHDKAKIVEMISSVNDVSQDEVSKVYDEIFVK
ncbi:Rpn family recombination-promoting nuclease/putative transposase [Ligilactobacillus animalis]|uniref:Rpn family recombination-promoting nuclease/putative transposase n=1 Tax=Ligilactobacillus animalis TaxID=1605 RepID=UPI0038505370